MDAAAAIETHRDRIETVERAHPDDRSGLLSFSDRLFLLQSQCTIYRHVKLLRHCLRLSENAGPISEALSDKKAAERIV